MSTQIYDLLERAAPAPSRAPDVAVLVRTARHRTRRRRRTLVIAVPLVMAAVLAGVASSSSLVSSPSTPKIVTRTPNTATKGTLPEVMPTTPDGAPDFATSPDFIATTDRTGKRVGYVKREDLMGSPTYASEVQTVYGEDLETVVGHMYPGRGFVKVGEDPTSVPPVGSSTTTSSTLPATTTTLAAPSP